MTTTTRSYHSPLRQAEAAATRARILDAAGELFGEQGYALTTMKHIAERAGVSVQTVHLAGPKSAILLAAYERLLSEAATAPPSDDMPGGAGLRRIIDASVSINRASAALWRALDAASHSDPLVKDALEAPGATDHPAVVLADLEAAGVNDPAVAAELSLLLGPPAYLHFTGRWGWTEEQLRDWLQRRADELVSAAD
jgi:AcrR family transcriptional regulator